MKNISILQVIGSLRGGGTEKVCLDLHKAFLLNGYKSTVFVLKNNVDYKIDENISFMEDENLLNEIKNKKFDLIIGHMQDIASKMQSIKQNKNVFFVIHTSVFFRLNKQNFFKRLINRYKTNKIYQNSNIIAVSHGVENDFLLNGKVKVKSSRVIYNLFDFNLINKQAQMIPQYNFNKHYIINIGSLSSVKRQDILLEAFSKIKSNVDLVILGKGGRLKKLQTLAHKLNISKKVHFLGWINNPYAYIQNAKLLILTSEAEGFPGVLIESLYLNTPVVSTNCISGPNEILNNELNQFLCEVNNPNDIAKKIDSALQSYPKIKNNFNPTIYSFENVVRQYISLIE
jgi:glycosyltransferase involved in cell wall biosynthesis